MTFNTLLLIFAVISLADGVIALLAPGAFLHFIWTNRSGAGADLFIRGWGACLVALSVMAWLVRSLNDSASRKLFALGLFVYFITAALVWLADGLSGGWTLISIASLAGLGLFALSFGYFRFARTASL